MADGVEPIGRAYGWIAALPLRLRRRAVRYLFLLKRARASRTVRGPAPGGTYADLFQRILRLSRREALRLEREAYLHDVAAEVEWLSLRERSLATIRRDMVHIRVEGEAVLERLAATGRPVILAPLHMGAYVLGLGHTVMRFFPGRRMLILRQRDDLAAETGVMERMREVGMDLRFLKVTDRSDFLAAVRFAKEGAVIVVFCDLPPSYGAPAPMPMFGLETSFAFGVEALARLTGAMVVPWSTTMEADGDTVRIGRPFETGGNTPEDRARVAGLMRDHIRDALRARPEQWHLWPTLPDYLPTGARLSDGDLPTDAGGSLRTAA